METGSNKKWVAIVYDRGDKISSHIVKGEEDKARPCAKEWVEKSFGKDTDWSLHQVYEK
tara:strand:- start:305 stop:481 length:177 start_codon:yes stop_codon:yes gene_type:complete